MTNARWSILCINFPDEPIVLIYRKSSVLNREPFPVLSRSPKRDEAFEDLLDVGGFGSGEGLGEGFGGGGAGGVEGQLHGAVHPGAVGDGEEEGQSWGRERFLRAFRELGGCWGTFFCLPRVARGEFSVPERCCRTARRRRRTAKRCYRAARDTSRAAGRLPRVAEFCRRAIGRRCRATEDRRPGARRCCPAARESPRAWRRRWSGWENSSPAARGGRACPPDDAGRCGERGSGGGCWW